MDRAPARWAQSLAGALATLAVMAFVGALASAWAWSAPGPAARHGNATTVILPKGQGGSGMGAMLEEAGVVRSSMIFYVAAQISGASHRLKAGEYAFPSGASLSQVLGKIRRGEIVHHRVTVPEGTPSQQVVDILNASSVLTGSVPIPPEGALLPETYDVVRGEQRAAVLQRMMDARDRVVTALWAHHKAGLPFSSSAQAVTLASIVEKETAKPSERPRVAAVYINRLRQGIRLQADPTVIYGVSRGAALGRGIRASELASDNPYNTYLHMGLPPGPIGNPGRASIAAVMDPPETEELYFVADGTGGHAFARTYVEQEQNVARWRIIERDRKAASEVPPPPAEHR